MRALEIFLWVRELSVFSIPLTVAAPVVLSFSLVYPGIP